MIEDISDSEEETEQFEYLRDNHDAIEKLLEEIVDAEFYDTEEEEAFMQKKHEEFQQLRTKIKHRVPSKKQIPERDERNAFEKFMDDEIEIVSKYENEFTATQDEMDSV